jgi:hypothetical protein
VETSEVLSKRFGGSCSFETRVGSQGIMSSAHALVACALVAVVGAVVFVFLLTRPNGSSSNLPLDPSKIRQKLFIHRNLFIITIADFLMTAPLAGIPLLFAMRVQRIMCTERQLPCSSESIFPSVSVINESNLYTSYLSSALGCSNFFGTLLIGSVSDIVGRRICLFVVGLGIVADCVVCTFCSDLHVRS